MVEILNIDPEANDHLRMMGPYDSTFGGKQQGLLEAAPLDAMDTAAAVWLQESVIGSFVAFAMTDEALNVYPFEKDFNPYTHFAATQSQYGDLEPEVRARHFDNVLSSDEFAARAASLRSQKQRRLDVSNGSTGGLILGGALSLIDLGTIVPFGAVTKGKPLANVAKMAFAGGAITGSEEVIIHAFQELRTADESFMNIGIGTVIGGGLGIFTSALSRSNLLNPKHPDNPLSPTQPMSMRFSAVGDPISDGVTVQKVVRDGKEVLEVVPDAAGTVRRTDAAGAQVADLAGEAVAMGKVGRTLVRGLPIGRLILATSPKAREFARKIADTGGVLTTDDIKGIARWNIEGRKAIVRASYYSLLEDFQKVVGDLRLKVAQITGTPTTRTGLALGDVARDAKQFGQDTATRFSGSEPPRGVKPTKGPLTAEEYQDVVDKSLHKQYFGVLMESDHAVALEKRFGKEAADLIIQTAQSQASKIHAYQAKLEDTMVRLGMIPEKDRLGSAYGMAQLWNARAIRSNRRSAMRFFTELFLESPADDWLMNSYKISSEDFQTLGTKAITIKGDAKNADKTYTAAQAINLRAEIMEDWSGEVKLKAEVEAEQRLAQAMEDVQAARREAVFAARDLRKNTTDIKHSTVDEAMAVYKFRQAELTKLKSEKQLVANRKKKIDTELRLLEEEQSLRMNAFIDTGKFTKIERAEVTEGERLLAGLEAQGADAAVDDINAARSLLTDADLNFQNASNTAVDFSNLSGSAGMKAALQRAYMPVYSNVISKLQERQRTLIRDANKVNSSLTRLEPKMDRLRKALLDAKASKAEATSATKMLRELKELTVKEARQAEKELKSATKAESRTSKKPAVHEYVRDLVDVLAKQQKVPSGILETAMIQSGRTKMRQIRMTPEQRQVAVDSGLLRNDVLEVLRQSNEDLGNHIALREVFGSSDPKMVLRSIEDDYNDMLVKAQTDNKSEKYIKSLERERDNRLKDVDGLWDRALGRAGMIQDPDDVLHWSMAKLRDWNFIKYGGGFLLTSITDIANVALVTGFHALTWGKISKVVKIMRDDMSHPEIHRLALMSERVLGSSRHLRMADASDPGRMMGIGDYGTKKSALTTAIDQSFNKLSQTVSIASGMQWYNTRLKALAMLEMQHNLVESVKDYSQLMMKAAAGDKTAELSIAKMSSVGLGTDQMRRIKSMMDKHPPVKTDGVFDIEMSRWLDEGDAGSDAYQDVLMALQFTANRAIMTPGIADTPLFMSKGFFKSLFQFQTYGFSIVNRFIVPGIQRGMTYGEMEAVMAFGLAASLGSVVVVGKDVIRDGKIKERSPQQWAYDVLDRAGGTAYMSPYVSGVYNAAASAFGWKETPSRYARLSQPLSVFLGPTGGTLTDIYGTGTNLMYGDGSAAGQHAMKLLPFQALLQLGNQLTDN